MAYQVLIVDDEPVIRFGIRASIPWEQHGMQVIGDCANGSEALELLHNQSLDILITDIKMPVMDGLALTREVIARYPHAKVILVSSYNDFDYVREAMRLGAMDYILKPTLEPEELLEVLHTCIRQLQAERSMHDVIDAYASSTRQLERKKVEQLLKRNLLQKQPIESAASLPSWMETKMWVVCVRLDRVHEGRSEAEVGELERTIVWEDLVETFYDQLDRGYALHISSEELLLLLPAESEDASFMEKLKGDLESVIGYKLTMGMDQADHAGQLNEAVEHSRLACQRRFFEGLGHIYQHEVEAKAVQTTPLSSQGESTQANQPEFDRFKSELMQKVRLNDNEAMQSLLQTWIKTWQALSHTACSHGDEMRIKHEACELLSLQFSNHMESVHLLERFDAMKETETIEDFLDTFLTQVEECHRLLDEKQDRHPSYDSPMERALDYIHEHYQQDIHLQEVADIVHISKNYFSILFKKYTEQNFIDYVIQLRIRKAKELLEHTELKVYEVAEASGFNDVKYFSKLFKKMTSCSPVDYREIHRGR
ncbi:response regulator [Marinicrinis sediminis]|uniref:Response regulator n=1 Tax=Marinicrinis sediminis TaxID=1652465 RepID=A0ABW5R8L5_9BACL